MPGCHLVTEQHRDDPRHETTHPECQLEQMKIGESQFDGHYDGQLKNEGSAVAIFCHGHKITGLQNFGELIGAVCIQATQGKNRKQKGDAKNTAGQNGQLARQSFDGGAVNRLRFQSLPVHIVVFSLSSLPRQIRNRTTVSPCLSIFTSVHGAMISSVSRFVWPSTNLPPGASSFGRLLSSSNNCAKEVERRFTFFSP